MEKTPQEMPRDFTGLWISKEIWFNNTLSLEEKCLFAEIQSLDTSEKGCFASNEYFCKFFNLGERALQKHLSRLKNLGFIRLESFDGRRRILRATKTTYEKFDTSAPNKSSPLPRTKVHPSPIGDSIDRENKVYNKENTSTGSECRSSLIVKDFLKPHKDKFSDEQLVKLGLIPERYFIAAWIACQEKASAGKKFKNPSQYLVSTAIKKAEADGYPIDWDSLYQWKRGKT